jgi:hypothetical protein
LESPVGRLAHGTGVPGDDPPVAAASLQEIDNVEVAAEVPAVRSRFLRLEQTNDRKIVCELASCMVALLARFGFESLNVIHPHSARQAALRDVRHAKCELEGDEMVQGVGVLTEDGVTEVLFELAGLLGELRVGIGRRGQWTYRALFLSGGNGTDDQLKQKHQPKHEYLRCGVYACGDSVAEFDRRRTTDIRLRSRVVASLRLETARMALDKRRSVDLTRGWLAV